MAFVIADRVRETTSTTGTGTITLAGPYTGFQAFSVIGNGNTTYYAIIDATTGAWEVGIGTYTTSGNTLSRTTVLASSNADALVNFSAGVKDVICTQPAERTVLVQTGGTGLVAGAAAFTANGVPYANSTSTLTTGSALTFDGGANLSTGGSNASTYNTLNINNTASNGYSRLLFNIGASGANGVGAIKYAPGIFFAIGTDSDASSTPMTFNLNGSEQMRLTSTGLGIGTNSPSAPLDIQSNSGGTGIRVIGRAAANAGAIRYFANDNTTQRARIESNDTGFEINSVANLPMYFNINNSEQMRLTSTGLGIGTSSPAARLHVVSGSDEFFVFGSTSTGWNYGTFRHVSSGDLGYIGDGVSAVTGYANTDLAIRANQGSLLLATNGNNVRATLDSAGNLGLGVTPSAWNAAYKALQVSPRAAITGDSAQSIFSHNLVISGTGDRYIGNGFASLYTQLNGQHAFFTAPSGTAGNAISFTQAMTLNAAGNLLLGSTTAPTGFSRVSLVGGESSGSGANSGIQLTYNASTFGGGAITTVNAAGGGLSFYTFTGNVGSEAYTERARITSSGFLGVGTTAPARNISVGASAGTPGYSIDWTGDNNPRAIWQADHSSGEVRSFCASNYFPTFYSNNAERARITLGGSLLVGTTSENARFVSSLEGFPSTGGVVAQFRAGTTSPTSERYVELFQSYTGGGFDSPMLVFRANANSSNQNSYGTIRTDSGGSMVFSTVGTTSSGVSAAAERARIDSSGNFLVGVTSNAGGGRIDAVSTSSFAVIQARSTAAGSGDGSTDVTVTRAVSSGASAWANAKYDAFSHRWGFGGSSSVTEAMRIDGSGRLLVGATSTYSNASKATIQGQQTGGGDGVVAIYNDQATSADASPPLVLYKAMTTTSSSARFVQFYAGGTATPMGGIVGNGASNVQFASLSDAREKTNIAPISGSLEKIVALKPVAFDWIANSEHCPAGFVAQDVEQVFPEFVVENMANDGQESRKGLTGGMTGGIIAHLVKAIQEQQAIINQLKADVAALKGA